ncbi:PAS domain S-box protein [Gimesia algae]|uniref:Sensor protein FixL n=1 Tax=Gimesia algae TaxID=2527971 RepID=A0A517VF82_9PLAN|nr:PAS domain S-box protein [Gimesia algae]QDT91664.1 Sensor protein FixL [Gimesia algae]
MSDKQRFSVLLVEPDPESRLQIMQILSTEGFQVDTAETIDQLMNRDNWLDYFLIILEHELPDGKTDDLLSQIQQQAKHAELVIITSRSEVQKMVLAFRNEIADYFIKPIDHDLFKNSLLRIRAERDISSKLRQTQAQLNAIVEAAIEAVITINRRGMIQSFNPAAEKMFGYSTREIIGQNISLLTPLSVREHHDQFISHYLETGISNIVGARRELQACHRDGSLIPIELSVTDLPQFEIFAGIVTDISERKQAEQKQVELTRAVAVAAQQERRQLANILHDHLQQLLVGVRIHLEIARKGTHSEAEEQTLTRADELLNQSIEVTRSLTAELNPVVLHEEGLAMALEWLAHNMLERYNLTVALNLDETVSPQAELTKIVLYECIREILFNVVKHSQTSRADVRMQALSDQEVEITVSDEGVGFDPQRLETQLSKAGGMGLSNIEFRLSLIKGKFHLESTVGKGTVAHIIVSLDASETDSL